MPDKRGRRLTRQEKIEIYVREIYANPSSYMDECYSDYDVDERACELADSAEMYETNSETIVKQ